jgi:hypothetical protein
LRGEGCGFGISRGVKERQLSTVSVSFLLGLSFASPTFAESDGSMGRSPEADSQGWSVVRDVLHWVD